MIALDLSDKIKGDASAATVVDYTLHGIVGTTVTQLADGQLAATIGDLYTAASAGIAVTSIVLVNTDSSARTVNLYLTPSAGTARRLIPKNLSLGIGFSLMTDGVKMEVYDASGNLLTSNASILDNTAGGTNGEVTKAPTSDVLFDALALKAPLISPSFTTPSLGVATATSINALTLTAAAVGFTIAGGTTPKTLTVPLDASVSGTNTGDNTVATSGDSATAFFPSGILEVAIGGTGVAVSTGTVAVVLSTSPTLVTPILGIASATSLATSAAIPFLLTYGQLVNIALTSQTVGATTLTIPNFASVVDTFTFNTLAAELLNKTLNASILKGTFTASGTVTLPAITLGGTITGGSQVINSLGHIGIGAASRTDAGLNYDETYTDPSDLYAFYTMLRLKFTANNAMGATTMYMSPTILDGNAVVTQTGQFRAFSAQPAINNQTQAQSFTQIRGYHFGLSVGTNATLANSYADYVANATGGGILTNQYGIYIEALTKGATLNWGIYSLAECYFAGINIASGSVLKVNSIQVVGARVVDARADDVVDETYGAEEAGVLDALRDAMITHGLIAAA